ILAILGGATNGVEKSEMLIHLVLTEFFSHGALQPPLHFLGLASEHRGLVRDTDRLEMNIRIEPGGVSAFELLQELLLVAAIHDVIADVVGLRQRKYDEIMPACGGGLRTGRLGFFVPRLAVN